MSVGKLLRKTLYRLITDEEEIVEESDEREEYWRLESVAKASFAAEENQKFRAATLRKDGSKRAFVDGLERLGQYYALQSRQNWQVRYYSVVACMAPAHARMYEEAYGHFQKNTQTRPRLTEEL